MHTGITKYEELSPGDIATMKRARLDSIFTLNGLPMDIDNAFIVRQVYTTLNYVPQYVESCAEVIREVRDAQHFVIHDMPNIRERGWSWAWMTADEFCGWWAASVKALKREFPDIKIGYPRLRTGGGIGDLRGSHHVFLQRSSVALEVADFVAVDVVWRCGEDSLSELYDAVYYVAYVQYTTGLPVMVTYHNNNNNVSKQQKAEQYVAFLSELNDNHLAFAAFCHTLSSDLRSDLWSVWRTEKGESVIPKVIGKRKF
jgi:hypothetical protein